jgi:hypothetical protein
MRLLTAVATAAGVIAVLSGAILYGGIWAGAGFFGPARWYAIGGHIAVVAVVLAGAVAWPAHKLTALVRMLVAQGSPLTAEQKAERDRLMNRVTIVTQLNAAQLIVTVTLMAIGRYGSPGVQ